MEEKDSAPLLNEQEVSQLKREDDFLPAYIWVPAAIWRVLKGIVLWVVGFIIDILASLWRACVVVYRAATKGTMALWKGIKSIGHKFRYNDIWGRLSFGLFGVSHLAHRRYFNGLVMLVFEIVYIAFFALNGVGSIASLSNLGDIKKSTVVVDPITGIGQQTPADNSVLILVYGILWIISIFLFLYVWKRSIDAGYKNYRITHYEDFVRREETAKPYSDLIDRDIAEHELYTYSLKELRERYSEVYSSLQEKASLGKNGKPSEMDKAYFRYILDSTITYRKQFHSELTALNLKKDKMEESLRAYLDEPKAAERIDELQALSKEAEDKYRAGMAKIAELPPSATAEQIKQAKSGIHGLRLKKILAENRLVGYRQSREGKADKRRAKIRLVSTKIEELEKNNLSFSTIDSVENQSQFGKFNVYYRRLADLDRSILFYSNYQEFVDAYKHGLESYQEANAANITSREALTKENSEKLAAIAEQYDAIEARRSGMLEEMAKERENLKAALGKISADPSLTDSEKRAKAAEARAACAYNLKTLKGKILSLPSKKEVKASRKEDVVNTNKAYKRDYKGLRVDYTPEEYAVYCAANKMIVDYGFDYVFANEKAKKEIKEKPLSEEQVKQKLVEVEQKRREYVEKTPNKFDGKPKTLLEQVKSLFDENFHIFLLALPILGVVFFTIMPLALSILVAFTNFNNQNQPPTAGFSWIGWDNFAKLLLGTGSGQGSLAAGMSRTIIWTFVWAVCATFSNYFLGIIMALLINKDGIKLKGFWRFMFMISIAVPQFISLIAMSILLSNTGALSGLYQQLTGSPLNFAVGHKPADVTRTKVIIILVNIWIGVPYTILSTSGILMNIPRDLYESSKIDGANAFVQFTKITLPYIFFVTGPSLIQSFIGNINNFGVIYFLTGGGATYDETVFNRLLGETDLLITYIYKVVTSVNNSDFGLASTIGIFVFVICAFISLIMYNRSSAVSGEDTFQ